MPTDTHSRPHTLRPAAYCWTLDTMATVARTYGYALAVHGSVARDFDVVAVPWADEVASPEYLATKLAECLPGRLIHGPTAKPHGRLAWTIGFPDDGDFTIDLSVIPTNGDRSNAH